MLQLFLRIWKGIHNVTRPSKRDFVEDISLSAGYQGHFTWDSYCREEGVMPAPHSLFTEVASSQHVLRAFFASLGNINVGGKIS